MKNKTFYRRLGFAVAGIRSAWRTEKSFRTQLVLGLGSVAILIVLRPEPVWWALFLLCIGGVLSAELVNTALEYVVDRLHPETHPMIARAKDCAAGAVLIMSLASLGVFAALVIQQFSR